MRSGGACPGVCCLAAQPLASPLGVSVEFHSDFYIDFLVFLVLLKLHARIEREMSQ